MWTDALIKQLQGTDLFAFMARGTFEHLFGDTFLDNFFTENTETPPNQLLPFSTVCTLLSNVVLRLSSSIRSAYEDLGESNPDALPVTLKAVYENLQKVEPDLVEALVQEVAVRSANVLQGWSKAKRAEPVAGLRMRIIDGNFLAGTDHRLGPLRGTSAAALPGMSIVIQDHATGLISNVLTCEDAYASERRFFNHLIDWVEPNDLIVADRNYCVCGLLLGIAEQQGFFVIRHHQHMHLDIIEGLRPVGVSITGNIFEQKVRVGGEKGKEFRCIVIERNEPTEDGETRIVLLTNVSEKMASALEISTIYRNRWKIEKTFQQMTTDLHCEVKTLAYPKAAIFGFCLALCSHNLLTVLKGAMAEVHGVEKLDDEFSNHRFIEDVKKYMPVVMSKIPLDYWTFVKNMSMQDFREWLLDIARRIRWKRYQKANLPKMRLMDANAYARKKKKKAEQEEEKKKKKKKKVKGGRTHQSTARTLNRAKRFAKSR